MIGFYWLVGVGDTSKARFLIGQELTWRSRIGPEVSPSSIGCSTLFNETASQSILRTNYKS